MDAVQPADVEVYDEVKGSEWESSASREQEGSQALQGLQILEDDVNRDGEEGKRDEAAQCKDASKKKRASKTAKLKQSKLDIRREQFLAQVAGKSAKATAILAVGKDKSTPRATASTRGSNPSSCDSSECTNGTQSSTTGSCGSSVCTNGAPEDEVEEDHLQNLEAAFSEAVTIKEKEGAAEVPPPELDVGENSSQPCQDEAKGAPVEVLVRLPVSGKTQGLSDAVGEGGPLPPDETSGVKAGGSCRGTGKRQSGKKSSGASGKNGYSHRGKASSGDSAGTPMVRPDGTESPGSVVGLNSPEDDDWEAAAEEFTKQVIKATKPGKAEDSKELPQLKTQSSTLPTSKGAIQGKPIAAGAEYNLRPNQQEALSARLDTPHGQRPNGLCGPNGLRPAYACSGSSFIRSGAGPRHSMRSAGHLEDDSSFSRPRSSSDRAWRPDDLSRPQTFPPAMVHRGTASRGLLGVPMGDSMVHQMDGAEIGLGGASWGLNEMNLHDLPHSQWPAPHSGHGSGGASAAANAAVVSQPQCCPICAEELDVTDSSFDPCSCGFRLCLFCHHRIAADDGRCPGCRRAYSADVAVRQPKQPHVWLKL